MNYKEDFWSTKYGRCAELTDEMVSKAEERLGVKLPSKLIELLKIQNGGYTYGFGYKMSEPTSYAKHFVPFDELYGLDPNHVHPTFNIMVTEYMIKEEGFPKGLVALCGDCHYFVALDYRKSENPSIRWFDFECKQDIHVCDSFDEFIANLITSEECAELEGL